MMMMTMTLAPRTQDVLLLLLPRSTGCGTNLARMRKTEA